MAPPRPHPFARSRRAELANRAIAAIWKRGWDPKPPLEPDYLWKVGSRGFSEADERSIRSEEDVADFRLRLEKLCVSLSTEAKLNALGHTMAYGQLRGAIRNRHALGRLWREQPELATTPIAPPIIVIGQMRSGTTRVQRMLAADPRHAGTRFCDSHNPVPATPDLRALKSRAALALARQVNPWLDTFHPFGPTRTDEEIGWLSAALSPAAYEAQWRIPSYVALNENRDSAAIYREFSRILRSDAARHNNADRPRVLKCPQFSEDLPVLIAQFPDARIVHCQRNLAEVLGSSVSMVASQMAFQSDEHDLESLEAEWLRKLSLRDKRIIEGLASLTAPSATVAFAQLNRDWTRAMAVTYRKLGLNFTEEIENAMAREQGRSHRGAHTQHRAFIEDFAL